MKNSREDILAEINLIKAMLYKLWEESHGNISRDDWKNMKKKVIEEMRK
tara:strand:- start:533 stop:679 length:147 start_codon:yes stop_codon:yes gene_type:complete